MIRRPPSTTLTDTRLPDTTRFRPRRPDRRAAATAQDRAAGLVPVFVVANLGTTPATALDPVGAMAEVARAEGAWLHVDAAHAGSGLVCPEVRWISEGIEGADSVCVNPHKWLLTNFDGDCCRVADRSALIGALSVLAEYLRNAASESGAVIDYRDRQIGRAS